MAHGRSVSCHRVATSSGRYLCAIALACSLSACGTIPSKFVHQAEPRVTLTALKTHPEAYRGKVVILGGVIVEKREEEGRIWLWIKNRPLDNDYVPHVPVSSGTEAGHYWVAIVAKDLPASYKSWARMTVVGRVYDPRADGPGRTLSGDPVLLALYVRGWGSGLGGYGVHEATWESTYDANYIATTPTRTKPD